MMYFRNLPKSQYIFNFSNLFSARTKVLTTSIILLISVVSGCSNPSNTNTPAPSPLNNTRTPPSQTGEKVQSDKNTRTPPSETSEKVPVRKSNRTIQASKGEGTILRDEDKSIGKKPKAETDKKATEQECNQSAIARMKAVPKTDPNYKSTQIKITECEKKLEENQKKANATSSQKQ